MLFRSGTTGVTYAVGDTVKVAESGSGTGTANFSQPIINLVEATDGQVLEDQSVLCLSGNQVGITYWYNGVSWSQAQLKESVQQAPLFDIFDSSGVSFSNRAKYPSSSFVGTKLFSYAQGSAPIDPILQFRLRYLSLSNVGDIVFDNNFYADTFVYVRDNVSDTINISLGYVREYADRTQYQRRIGWQTAEVPTFIRQQFKFVYDGTPLQLDVPVLTSDVTTVPPVKVFVGSVFQDPNSYSVVIREGLTRSEEHTSELQSH